jgi:hypothetical protein
MPSQTPLSGHQNGRYVTVLLMTQKNLNEVFVTLKIPMQQDSQAFSPKKSTSRLTSLFNLMIRNSSLRMLFLTIF